MIVVWFASVTVGNDANAPWPERDAHLDEARDVRRLATRGHVVEDVRVGAVEQKPDDVARALLQIEQLGQDPAVLHRQVPPVADRRAAEQGADRGGDVDEAGRLGHEPARAHAFAREHERGPGLHQPERAVLTEVAALVLPVVGGGVQDAEVGGGGRVEELGDLVEGVRVRVLRPVRERMGELVGEGGEPVGRLVAEGVAARSADPLVGAPLGTASGPAERDPPVGRERLVEPVSHGTHHVDDGCELPVEQDLQRRIRLGPVGVGHLVRAGHAGGFHDVSHGVFHADGG